MEKILILDFGSQYTQLIARAVREANVFCEIIPYQKSFEFEPGLKGIILSGSPFSVNDPQAPEVNVRELAGKLPVLGICYGAQLTARQYGGRVDKSDKREYGRAMLQLSAADDPLLENLLSASQVWMSHSDTITELPVGFELLATTDSIPVAAFRSRSAETHPLYGLQFHPEVYHSTEGKLLLKNFLVNICGCRQSWTPAHFITDTVAALKQQIGDRKVIMALSGGVDSTVAATLIHRAIGKNLYGIFVDNGLLRKNEFGQVLEAYQAIGLNVKGVDAKTLFYKALEGKTDPEQKRKIIGGLFIDVFQEEAKKVEGVGLLGQGTIYPDVIESVSVHGPSVTIKSHHNVGGLPDDLQFELVEPLRALFKDEVRLLGAELGLPPEIVSRHPFPGPGLGVRIIGEITAQRLDVLRAADAIVREEMTAAGVDGQIWQCPVVLLADVHTVGVKGDGRTYGMPVVLRPVTSEDAMTADWARLPDTLLSRIAGRVTGEVDEITRVVLDVTSKPPGTIEWE